MGVCLMIMIRNLAKATIKYTIELKREEEEQVSRQIKKFLLGKSITGDFEVV